MYALLMNIAVNIASGIIVYLYLTKGTFYSYSTMIPLIGELSFCVDGLAVFYIIIINTISLFSSIYLQGYLKYETDPHPLNLHLISFNLLQIFMLLVAMVQNLIPFLIFWEIMTLASFLVMMFENDQKDVMKAALYYFVQMHICIIFLTGGTIMLQINGYEADFGGLAQFLASGKDSLIFLIFFIGFAFKAGFIPLHTWLPHVYNVAPAHASALFSGAMSKMGIYGIIRLISMLQYDFQAYGIIMLVVGAFSSIYGIIHACMQNELKKTIAYSSIENMGIIGLALGLGVLGKAVNNEALSYLGFAAAIMHILNHALYKPLLFYGAGAVYHATGTKNMNLLGGIAKNMPVTAIFFLTGCVAISGLPPFNGFISEYIIYDAIMGEFKKGDVSIDELLVIGLVCLSFTGGLSLFCFSKMYGITFLGSSRSSEHIAKNEADTWMLVPQALICIIILCISLFPFLLINMLNPVIMTFGIKNIYVQTNTISMMNHISIVSILFIIITIAIYLLKTYVEKHNTAKYGPTWGCGYTAPTSKLQYTSTSFTQNLRELASIIIYSKNREKQIHNTDIYPAKSSYVTNIKDVLEVKFVTMPAIALTKFIKRFAVFQTGRTQTYILYAFAFIIGLFLITYLQLI
ncbi:MAG: proton-conducting transporter membrane subunit [Cytophagales bacterium]|nr:proton-conducting transporter membrane subunit [Cytophagales bacterium]